MDFSVKSNYQLNTSQQIVQQVALILTYVPWCTRKDNYLEEIQQALTGEWKKKKRKTTALEQRYNNYPRPVVSDASDPEDPRQPLLMDFSVNYQQNTFSIDCLTSCANLDICACMHQKRHLARRDSACADRSKNYTGAKIYDYHTLVVNIFQVQIMPLLSQPEETESSVVTSGSAPCIE